MIGTIGPLGEGDIRKAGRPALLFLLGSVVGSVCAGTLLGLAGWCVRWVLYGENARLPPGVLVVMAGFALLGGLVDVRIIRLRPLQYMCQVPREWLYVYGANRTALAWSFCISAGIMTVYTYALFHVLALWVLLVGSPSWGALVFFTFGLSYGVVSALSMISFRRPRFRGWLESFLPSSSAPRLAAGVAQLAAALMLLLARL